MTTLGTADTVLTERAATYLAAGPADSQTLISHVCQLPGAPPMIAEHMAAALFAGHQRFRRTSDGRWALRDLPVEAATWPSSPKRRGARVTARGSQLDETSFVVVDVEATGSRAYHGDRITEIAVVHVQRGVATPVFETLVNPERPIPPAVMALTNITAEMVRSAPRFAEVCDQLLGTLEGHVFVAHNANFDWRFLSAEVERATARPLIGRRLCTVRLARRLVPQLQRRNLDAVAHFYGIVNHARHRAGGDALATARAFTRLLDAARDRGIDTIDELDRLSRTPSGRRRRKRSAMPHPVFKDTTA
ncbi:MAG TPA: 3'-5' exonuclease [Gemmatimonadaceae bacterium]|jgi:DNA polymerase-3 subunit epsilon|nr:3'-5' exonuclease [Gemmatimonadaceae bacterium]